MTRTEFIQRASIAALPVANGNVQEAVERALSLAIEVERRLSLGKATWEDGEVAATLYEGLRNIDKALNFINETLGVR